ncbi:LacI family DNA-binding transcriptional regulator [Rubellicoccus peritrichatus]|uniref:LacI family DNA-binding transcriptional regulator n=1 Tax=Rubellicoccus peritrichatus TaxID=3080537 RepID=A0AAQ3LC32_9BACT|nr:LacI family DNA-binding transcriptional regulator [Puniceicoccus sp. CR14]WOO43349.1 LacI family DNA-binding transcriptional regulator [Puniceicoccus sp. CR14]
MEDIARECGVSKMTISRVLNGKKNGVSDSKRDEILAVADRMKYRTNRLAKSFFSNRSGFIGLALPFEGLLGSYYFARLVSGIQDALKDSEWELALFDTLSESFDDGQKLASLYLEKRVDGLIAIAPHYDDKFVESITEEEIPILVAGEPALDDAVLTVNLDDEAGIEILFDHLRKKGHKDIGFISGPDNVLSAQTREAAYRMLMSRHRLLVKNEWIIKAAYSREEARNKSLKFLTRKELPTAMIAANDSMALGFLDAAIIRGIKVPDAISIVGFDDLQESASSYPKLTTVHQPIRRLGCEATRTLINWINNGQRPEPLPGIPAKLVIRQSVRDLS